MAPAFYQKLLKHNLYLENRLKPQLIIILLSIATAYCQTLNLIGKPEIYAPGIVSTEISEVKITFSKNGNWAFWGAIGRENGIGGFDIWQSQKTDTGWSKAQPASFNSSANDFDPCFSADGTKIYFFSNRPGGFGGDDFYYSSFDNETNTFGEPTNMGEQFNTAGDEWGPCESSNGEKFIFCTDGRGGSGKHDIFMCDQTMDGWSIPKSLDILNSEKDDFDPVILHDNKTIIFTREESENEAFLHISYLSANGYSKPERINGMMNMPGTWNFGSCINIHESDYIYYSSRVKDKNIGRLDIYRIKYTLTGHKDLH